MGRGGAAILPPRADHWSGYEFKSEHESNSESELQKFDI